MTQNLNIPVLGPEEPAINRIRNEYIRTIIIKIPINTSIVSTKDGFKNVEQF
jgi:primosomal protein N' (replication factor Y)